MWEVESGAEVKVKLHHIIILSIGQLTGMLIVLFYSFNFISREPGCASILTYVLLSVFPLMKCVNKSICFMYLCVHSASCSTCSAVGSDIVFIQYYFVLIIIVRMHREARSSLQVLNKRP